MNREGRVSALIVAQQIVELKKVLVREGSSRVIGFAATARNWNAIREAVRKLFAGSEEFQRSVSHLREYNENAPEDLAAVLTDHVIQDLAVLQGALLAYLELCSESESG